MADTLEDTHDRTPKHRAPAPSAVSDSRHICAPLGCRRPGAPHAGRPVSGHCGCRELDATVRHGRRRLPHDRKHRRANARTSWPRPPGRVAGADEHLNCRVPAGDRQPRGSGDAEGDTDPHRLGGTHLRSATHHRGRHPVPRLQRPSQHRLERPIRRRSRVLLDLR